MGSIRTDCWRLWGRGARRIRFMYLVTVNNPTCSILSNARRRHVVELIEQLSHQLDRKVQVIFDTAYELLIHDPKVEKPQSALLNDPLEIVYEVGTLSNLFAPALRIGFLIGPPSSLIDAMVQKFSDVGFSAPLLNQCLATVLLDEHIETQMTQVHRSYREKASCTRRWIDHHLGKHLSHCAGGQGGFYYYLTFDSIETHETSAFFRFLTRTTGDLQIDGPAKALNPRVVYIPGEYCVHRGGELIAAAQRHLQLSYGFEELPRSKGR